MGKRARTADTVSRDGPERIFGIRLGTDVRTAFCAGSPNLGLVHELDEFPGEENNGKHEEPRQGLRGRLLPIWYAHNSVLFAHFETVRAFAVFRIEGTGAFRTRFEHIKRHLRE